MKPAMSPSPRPSMKSLGRRAGLRFFLHGLPAPFALLIVPGCIFVRDDIAATADRVREHALLLRVSIVAEIWQCLFLVFAAIAIYRLLREVDQYLAVVTAALIWISLPIQLVNLLNHMAPLALASGTTYLTAFTSQQVNGLIYLFVGLHAQGIQVTQVFGDCGSSRGVWPPFAPASCRAGSALPSSSRAWDIW